MRSRAALAALLTILVATVWPAPGGAGSCDPQTVWGLCVNTLPRLVCCSQAYLGWSQVIVGDTFPLSGRVFRDAGPGQSPPHALVLVYPSGREVRLALDPAGSFREVVSFDEEGVYHLYRETAGTGREEIPAASFTVAYLATPLATPAVEEVFHGHPALQGNVTVAVPYGQPVAIPVRFTDARGNPVKNRVLAIPGPSGPIMTDADGVATLRFTPEGGLGGYELLRLYPGLVALSYREVAPGPDGRLTGLPGGDVQGVYDAGRWLFPLRDFLASAYPLRYREVPDAITWDPEAHAVRLGAVTLMAGTGQVLRENGNVAFRVPPRVIDGRIHLDLPSLARLFDLLAWGTVTPAGNLRIAAPEVP